MNLIGKKKIKKGRRRRRRKEKGTLASDMILVTIVLHFG
jgi:hypothetical protein